MCCRGLVLVAQESFGAIDVDTPEHLEHFFHRLGFHRDGDSLKGKGFVHMVWERGPGGPSAAKLAPADLEVQGRSRAARLQFTALRRAKGLLS